MVTAVTAVTAITVNGAQTAAMAAVAGSLAQDTTGRVRGSESAGLPADAGSSGALYGCCQSLSQTRARASAAMKGGTAAVPRNTTLQTSLRT